MVGDESLSEHLFGPIPDSFFAMLGQTIAAAGLVELKVYDLLTSLDQVEQHVYAGEPLHKMLDRCRTVLQDRFRPEFGYEVEQV